MIFKKNDLKYLFVTFYYEKYKYYKFSKFIKLF